MKTIKNKAILILDFGSQYTQLIARRIREMGVYCEVHPYYLDRKVFEALAPSGIVLSGGPATVVQASDPRAPQWVFEADIPLLGICYGMQAMAIQLGGQVEPSLNGEFGHAALELVSASRLWSFTKSPGPLDVWMSHGDKVSCLPPGFSVIAKTQNTDIAAMADESRGWYGLQFHPEVTHTPEGFQMLEAFVFTICGAEKTWTATAIIADSIASIRAQVGQEKVILGLSGGVDSSVAACLLHKALGAQLICVFVDTGLLRLREPEQVMEMFVEHLGIHVIEVKAQDLFLDALKGITDPEEKRKIIGRVFIEVFEGQAQQLTDVSWLAQGTIYPDVIESAATSSGSSSAVVIKSHHNVGGLPANMRLKLLEPLRELFKDEVRKIGIELGLAEQMVYRHPFPGPGLGVRILGEVRPEYLDILKAADAIFIEELHAAGLYAKVSQAFAVFLPVKSVAVMGDGRRYDYVICLRAVETVDFMTASWSHLPWDFLGQVSNRIMNEVRGISRVTYDISGKPPSTIEWE